MSNLLSVKYNATTSRCLGRFLWLTALCSVSSFSQEDHERAGTDEFSFISRTTHARPAGLAGAYSALADGNDAIGANPAGLAGKRKGKWISAGIKKNFLEVHSGDLTYPFKDEFHNQYAVSINYTHFGTIEGLDVNGFQTGQNMRPSNHTPSITAARQVTQRIRAGASLKLPTEYLGAFEGSKWALGWAVDAGMQYQPNSKQITLGAAVLNAGRKEVAHTEGGDRGGLLPLEIRGGVVYHSLALPEAMFTLDYCLPYHYHSYLAGGVQYSLSKAFLLRAGSRVNLPELEAYFREFVLSRKEVQRPSGNALKLAAGFSLSTRPLIVDYAAQYWHLLGFVHYVTLKWRV